MEALFRGEMGIDFRSFYMKRSFEQAGQTTGQESLAFGGSVGYRTRWWNNLRAGATVFTSQGAVFTDPDKSGAGILGPRQTGYNVLGHAYVQGRLSKTEFTAGRQELVTPFVNPYDVRMTPYAFEAYTIQSKEITGLTFVASHVAKIKKWTSTDFDYMSDAAGLTGSHRPLTMAGAIYEPRAGYRFQFWDYYCYDFMNVFYFQGDKEWDLGRGFFFLGSAQMINQHDVGSALAGTFNTSMAGVRATLKWKELGLTLAYTATDTNHDVYNPWGGYPGYTSIMEEDNDRAGENTWLASLFYDFSSLGAEGLDFFTIYTDSSTPKTGPHASPSQREMDFNLQFRPKSFLKGLSLRMRACYVSQDKSMGGKDIADYRIILNYRLPIGSW